MVLILIVVAVLVVAGVAFWWWLKMAAAKPSEAGESKPASQDPDVPEQLLDLNLEIRRASIPNEVTTQAEGVIDQLRDLLPKVEEKASPTGELSWMVRRIATEYLPNKCLRPYLNLDSSAQKEPETLVSVKQSLTALSAELDGISETLKDQDESEFNKKALFLKHKFNIDGEV
ncbi:hypothetical protein ACMXYV_06125 [Neptuniibacter sp. SY11_33]|uniref:hypothetical protein n=1 Tax=Neptuniibacter sp. SY11_33 TaxID=3398215 RepID=UPI0039F501C5